MWSRVAITIDQHLGLGTTLPLYNIVDNDTLAPINSILTDIDELLVLNEGIFGLRRAPYNGHHYFYGDLSVSRDEEHLLLISSEDYGHSEDTSYVIGTTHLGRDLIVAGYETTRTSQSVEGKNISCNPFVIYNAFEISRGENEDQSEQVIHEFNLQVTQAMREQGHKRVTAPAQLLKVMLAQTFAAYEKTM